jgi:hypothetical protein
MISPYNVATAYAGLPDGALVSLTSRASVANRESHHAISFMRIAQSLFSFVGEVRAA